jgi:hypothetical protein
MDQAWRIRRNIRSTRVGIGGRHHLLTFGADVKVTVMEKHFTADPDCPAAGERANPLRRCRGGRRLLPARISRA